MMSLSTLLKGKDYVSFDFLYLAPTTVPGT